MGVDDLLVFFDDVGPLAHLLLVALFLVGMQDRLDALVGLLQVLDAEGLEDFLELMLVGLQLALEVSHLRLAFLVEHLCRHRDT